MIAKLDKGERIFGRDVRPGTLTDLACYPLVSQVQVESLIYFNFTTAHTTYKNAKVKITMPPGLVFPTDTN